ncbi:4a-hydroxytetrahydrobiopterin dehydratase [Brevibacterium jeotgali]|uniref:Putative pterin-4-alpha-carbinolamine dehydratase n=1 Tax=Brevibacterium jeotgali TaxID=1262550 RepID=A0A2H1L4D5_9MICO|nr:4a-hydroxytetrahydrobiopterin dehydratase [Brevibacterium jeotgali]TWB98631.1 4a-hydroxytetrahydrobiopterin dehydratase [Brevibacterium jeotgali]SMY11768.1 4a-hydroxytetrahydrobiopterin dehydratase [Brevibacterium jeotgali]
MTEYSGQQLSQALQEARLTDWSAAQDGLRARFSTGDFMAGLELVQRIAAVAEDAGHHPDLLLTYPHVDVRLISHDVEGVTERDLRLAQQISELAASAEIDVAPTD